MNMPWPLAWRMQLERRSVFDTCTVTMVQYLILCLLIAADVVVSRDLPTRWNIKFRRQHLSLETPYRYIGLVR